MKCSGVGHEPVEDPSVGLPCVMRIERRTLMGGSVPMTYVSSTIYSLCACGAIRREAPVGWWIPDDRTAPYHAAAHQRILKVEPVEINREPINPEKLSGMRFTFAPPRWADDEATAAPQTPSTP